MPMQRVKLSIPFQEARSIRSSTCSIMLITIKEATSATLTSLELNLLGLYLSSAAF